MMLLMQLTQPLGGDVRINLRGREIAVSQQHLYDTQVGAAVQQMGGEDVPQHVRRQFFTVNARQHGVMLDAVPEGLARHLSRQQRQQRQAVMRQPVGQRFQILAIGGQGILRQIAFNPEHIQKLFYQVAILHGIAALEVKSYSLCLNPPCFWYNCAKVSLTQSTICMKICLFYGSSTCYTEMAAEKIRDFIGAEPVTLHNVKDDDLLLMEQYDLLIFGIPT